MIAAHYDIAVIGVWYGGNYGSLLNGYALYKLLMSMGLSVSMIGKPNVNNDGSESIENHSARFIKKYYSETAIYPFIPPHQLHELNKFFETFCVGSDQIWNHAISKAFGKSYMLDFVDENKRKISFSTSFGHSKDFTPKEQIAINKTLLEGFNAISMREQNGVDMCRDIYGVEAIQINDPILCVDKEIFYDLAEQSEFHETDPYILAYILDPTPEIREAILYCSEHLNMKVINILDGFEYKWSENNSQLGLPNTLKNVNAEDFVKAFCGSSFVITDSFHGTVFATLFNKPFISIGNKHRGVVRFHDYLGRLNLVNRLVSDPALIIGNHRLLESFDYSQVNTYIESERVRAMDWLKEAITSPILDKVTKLLPETFFGTDTYNTKKNGPFYICPNNACTGCGACISICPVGALAYQKDDYGYYRACADGTVCIKCKKCIDVCPVISPVENRNMVDPTCYEFIAKDDSILFNSSSGGVFPLIAKQFLSEDGNVVGVAWREDFSVSHILIDKEEDLAKLLKSKYLQSYMGDIHKQVKLKLESGQKVLFTGCPCQVASLRGFLGKEYELLYVIDLLCHYSPSSQFFMDYINTEFGKGAVAHYEFRHKAVGWSYGCHEVIMKDGRKLVRRIKDDPYQRVFHNRTMISHACENCRFTSFPRYGDITLGDFHGIEKFDNELSDSYRKGISVVLVNNDKGFSMLNSVSSEAAVCKEVPLRWLNNNARSFRKPDNYVPASRDRFYKVFGTMKFSEAVEYALGKSSIRPNITNTIPLQYFSKSLHFEFDTKYWSEEYTNGMTVLSVAEGHSVQGNRAVLSLNAVLVKEKSYILAVGFRIKTISPFINFHIYNKNSRRLQVVATCNIKDTDDLQSFYTEFSPNADDYDSFMIGSTHIAGKDNYMAIEYINIAEA